MARFDRDLKDKEPKKDYQQIYDFQSRWRFAKSVVRIEAQGYAAESKVVDGYYALLRVLLACAAREQLAEVLGAKAYNELTMVNPSLARRVREGLYGDGTTKFAKALQKSKTSRIHRQLQAFWSGEHDDINLVALAVRHGVAHGSLTPSGIQLDSDPKKQIVLDLGDAVLADSEERFAAWVDEEISRRSGESRRTGL